MKKDKQQFPNGFGEVTARQYLDLETVLADSTKDDIDKTIHMYMILSKLTRLEVGQLPWHIINRSVMDLYLNRQFTPIPKSIWLSGREYAFINSAKSMTREQKRDLVGRCTVPIGGNAPYRDVYVVAALCVPVGERYDHAGVDEVAGLILDQVDADTFQAMRGRTNELVGLVIEEPPPPPQQDQHAPGRVHK